MYRRAAFAAACLMLCAATALAQQVGKPAPKLKVTDAKGLKKDFKLSDLEGKWVIIEFWGHW